MTARRWGIAIVVITILTVAVASSGSAASLSLTSQTLTPYRTCTISGTPATTTSVTDASVRQASPTSNFGTLTSSTVSSASAANQRLYVKFDLTVCSPAIAATAVVRLATLRLYMTGIPAACRTIDLFRVAAAWTESAITWNNQPFGTAINNPASGSRTDSFNVGTTTGCENQTAGYVVGGTVTSDVASFVAGGSTNLGWMARDDVEGSSTARTTTLSSKELATIGQVPQLVVTYVNVP